MRQTINNWVAQQTQNKIQDILPPGTINSDTRLVLANAIYFLGAWTYAFAETNTSTQPFFLSSTKEVQSPLMHQPALAGGVTFNYLETTNFQALELPYASNQLSMVILLPKRIDGLRQLEQQLSPSFLSNLLAQMSPQNVEVFLPRFTNEFSLNLTKTLPQMGMSDAFTPGVADFSGMDEMRDLFLSLVLHKAWVQVNEAGTEAAAATVVVGTTAIAGGGPPPPGFRADHPFVFFIRDTQTGNLLFLGRLTNPSQSPGTPVAAPKLVITPSGTGLTLSWRYSSTPWTLQQSPDLSTTHWTPTPVISTRRLFGGISNDGTNNFITITAPTGNLFFRLQQ